ncbi:hypothetical protein, variant [Phytophthora nicotianae CJ01A1]|uniref:Uncharacterized protein n=1 Tax=Phytophthora nicotianae CJ01A1 TaxID=1317063 RepID=W2WWG4_PHYNI|nr:hypothetical protein, variant [Phytophthora nicotianae CJ01A1]
MQGVSSSQRKCFLAILALQGNLPSNAGKAARSCFEFVTRDVANAVQAIFHQSLSSKKASGLSSSQSSPGRNKPKENRARQKPICHFQTESRRPYPVHMSEATSAREYDPLFPRSYAASSTTSTSTAPRCYGGFEQQKRVWASTARRSQRIRVIAGLQLLLGLLASGNYLWLSNIFMFIVGVVGLLAVRSDRMSWTVVYLLLSAMEFARIVMLTPHLYDRFEVPGYAFSRYEYFQVVVLVVEEVLLVVRRCKTTLNYCV